MYSKSLRKRNEGNEGWAKTGAQTVLPPRGGKARYEYECMDADLDVGRKKNFLIPSRSQNGSQQLRAKKGHLSSPETPGCKPSEHPVIFPQGICHKSTI